MLRLKSCTASNLYATFYALISALFIINGVANAQEGDAGVTNRTITQSCFGAENTFGCSLRADNTPRSLGASRPASFSYTLNNDGADSFAIAAALQARRDLGFAFGTLETQWDRNNQQSDEQNNFSVGAGLQFNFTNVDAVFDRWLESEKKASTNYWSVYLDGDVTYNRREIFANEEAQQCEDMPDLRACSDQFLETLRLRLDAVPFYSGFESGAQIASTVGDPGSQLFYTFSPNIGLFYDEALNDSVEMLTGSVADGGVLGLVAGATFAISPSVWRNKWEFSATAQIIEALDRDAGRFDDFEDTSRLFSASLSYALAGTYLNQSGQNALIPAISITYTNGSDSLRGRDSQDTLVLGLTVRY